MTTSCSIPRCDRKVIAKGLCNSHYQTQRMAAIRAEGRAVHRPCAVCGKDLAGKRPNAQFCSRECKDVAREVSAKAEWATRRVGRICRQCSGSIPDTAGPKAVTCSPACRDRWRNEHRQQERRSAWSVVKQPCPVCGKDVPDGLRVGTIYCSFTCKHNAASGRWRAKSPGYMRKYLYGMTPEQFADLLAKQGGRCAICGTDTPGGKGGWHVDHDHDTGAARGILCHVCNVGLGYFKDNLDRVESAASYLREPPAAS